MRANTLMSIAALFIIPSWGYESPHRGVHFLSAIASPDEEVMGPNLKFDKVSTTMSCIISLTIQYMVIYTALGVCRTYLDFQSQSHDSSPLQKALKHASETVFYAPMVCMMFVGFRMRVLQLSKGTGDPQDWVRFSMQAVTYSILANTLLVLLVPLFSATEVELEKETGELKTEAKNPFENPMLATIFTVIRYLSFLGLYVGFGCVCTGVFLYEPEAGVWEGPIPPLSPAVKCTMVLSTTFFMIYLLHAISRSYSQFAEGHLFTSTFEKVMMRAADTLGMAPMLCILFLAARMRALQMDPVGGNPQKWAQNCFFVCTYSLIAQTLFAVIVPLVLKGDVKEARVEGEVEFDVGEGLLAKVMTAIRFLIMLSVYIGAVAVVCSVFTIKHPDGDELTPPLSPTMQCVLNLCFQYFLIYGLLWIFITVEDFMGAVGTSLDLTSAKDAIESAKSTVQFAPMIAVLFVATRMRALQMTDNKGAPQGWCQDGMYLATWSILIQFMMCLIMPIFTGKKYTADSLDGPVKADNVTNPYAAGAVTFIRYSALIALIGGIATVITGVMLMTPETANGRGAIPLVTDGTLPVDLAPQPPGVNDIPGAKSAMKDVGQTVGGGADVVAGAGETVTGTVDGAATAVTGF
jgi:hypothetical protein